MNNTLISLSETIMKELRRNPTFARDIVLSDYHGFHVGKIPNETLKKVAGDNDYNFIQADIVRVTSDLSNQVHLHRRAHAYCTILGEQEHVEDQRDAYVFLNNLWRPVIDGERIDIPPTTPHGFAVKPKGNLYFLSLQTPPIKGDGFDDYEHIPSAPRLEI